MITKSAQTGRYNLKAVVQETGLKPDTLRAWERRYGLPKPDRTSGGHRLYSDYDIQTLKWLMARQEEGLSISRAVALWRSIKEKGESPLDEMPVDSAEEEPSTLVVGETLQQMRDAWLDACKAFNEQRAERVLAQALAIHSPETVCFQILQSGLATIGMEWYQGRATAQQEHFASNLAVRRIDSIIAMSPPPTRSGRILIGGPPHEEHTFPALILTMLMRRRGWPALYLGANIPLARLEATLTHSKADLVLLTAQTLPTAATMIELAQLLHEKNVPLAFGGLVFNLQPEVRSRIPGYFIGEDLRQAPVTLERILTTPSSGTLTYRYDPPAQKYLTALAHFQKRQAHIEAEVWDGAPAGAMRQHYLAEANRELASYIKAALKLGNMNFVSNSIDWLKGLLREGSQAVPDIIVTQYLELYNRAVKSQLDGRGDVIVAWFEGMVGHEQIDPHSNGNGNGYVNGRQAQ